MPVTVELFEEADLKDALVVVAFPSTGAAAPIAGTYLHQHLALPLVGHVTSEDLDGVSHIEGGLGTSPIRIHGGETQCHIDGPCPRIFTATSEVPIPPELLPEVAEAIAAWAREAKMILCLDAVGRDADDDTPDVFTAASTPGALKALQGTQADPLAKALVGGLTAYLLAKGRHAGPDAPMPLVATLIVEAAQNHPDGRAAAALIETLDRLVPELHVDPQPLLEDALALETEIKKAMDAAEVAQPRRPPHTFI